MDIEEQFYVSWRGKVTGPFSLEQIETRLKQRTINSLSRIKVGDDWLLLRDAIVDLRSKIAKPADTPDPAPTVELDPLPPAEQYQAQTVGFSEEKTLPVARDSVESAGYEISTEKPEGSKGRGLGITSFVLSFFFAVPILNMLTMVLAIIFGHIANRDGMGPNGARHSSLPWFALWTSYIHAGFLLMAFLVVALVAANLDIAETVIGEAILYLHAVMLGLGVAAALGAGLIMLAVKMLANYWPKFAVSYVCALAPLAVAEIAIRLLSTLVEVEGTQILIVYGTAGGIILVIQTLFWGSLIESPEGKPLGYSAAGLASLFYTIITFFITFLFGFLLGVLS